MDEQVKSLPLTQVREIFQVLRNLEEMALVLAGDVERGSRDLAANSNDQFFRRNLVRMFAAYVEGNSFLLKQVVLQLHVPLQVQISTDEMSKLKELRLDATGNVVLDEQGQPRKRYLRFHDNQKFATAVFASLCGGQDTVRYGVPGHEAFRRTIAVRDRLMHPKTIADLQVTDSETQDLQASWQWYQSEMTRMLNDSKAGIESRFAALLGQNSHTLKKSS